MRPACWVTMAFLALLLAGCASGGRSGNLAEVLNDARAHPENRLADEVGCERATSARTGDFAYKIFFAGLLSVPEAEGGRAFCAALIEAVIAGDLSQADQDAFRTPSEVRGRAPLGRSEEHTSELQSLMRISYAVFCLKKKKTKTTNSSLTR